MEKKFVFTATALWVTDAIIMDLPDKVAHATATVKRHAHPKKSCGGTLTVTAPTQEELNAVARYIARHALYSEHFKPKK